MEGKEVNKVCIIKQVITMGSWVSIPCHSSPLAQIELIPQLATQLVVLVHLGFRQRVGICSYSHGLYPRQSLTWTELSASHSKQSTLMEARKKSCCACALD